MFTSQGIEGAPANLQSYDAVVLAGITFEDQQVANPQYNVLSADKWLADPGARAGRR